MQDRKNLSASYHPGQVEARAHDLWDAQQCFVANPDSPKKPYSLAIPPPNVTGNLHLGHALNNVLQDILARWQRMVGRDVLWLPGMDHAGISTQLKVEAALQAQGVTRQQLGPEAFTKRLWEWKESYSAQVRRQWRRLGLSLDGTRERFTLDPDLSAAVRKVFVQLYDAGLIYRGRYLINWDPVARTALSDIEVEHKELRGHLYFLVYPLVGQEGCVEIATTRPETMFGDVAVAVHPKDDRYTHLIGQRVHLPGTDRTLPILADEIADPTLGSGVVKITPAHDFNDFAVGQRHNLPMPTVIDEGGIMTEAAGDYVGLDRLECRRRLVSDLQNQGTLVRTQIHVHSVGHSQRTQAIVEPRLSTQWFLCMRELAAQAQGAQEGGQGVRFVPERYERIYLQWVKNSRDWCLSRQLWWGHPIPAWYCADCKEINVAMEEPQQCSACQSPHLSQDPDVLDTWFSSALWPFATLGWPDEKAVDYQRYYPTQVMVTGYDIIYFWVARMIFMSLRFTEKIPFADVLITGLIRDAQGRKMSKSLGNGIDPEELIDEHGADALRMALVAGNTLGQDGRFREERMLHARHCTNKLWNAARFVLMQADVHDPVPLEPTSDLLTLPDRAVLHYLQGTVENATKQLELYHFDESLRTIEQFFWGFFCDFYIETVKECCQSENPARRRRVGSILTHSLHTLLRILHPFAPHITEEIARHLPPSSPPMAKALAVTAWPRVEKEWQNERIAEQMDEMLVAIRLVRSLRKEIGLPPHKVFPLQILVPEGDTGRSFFLTEKMMMERLCKVEIFPCRGDQQQWKRALTVVLTGGVELRLQLSVSDRQSVVQTLQKQSCRLQAEVERTERKLRNRAFIDRAPAEIVKVEQDKGAEYHVQWKRVQTLLREIGEK
ncbi:valine--tRNA ligase [Pasteuria penetrans]|uniref:valine--tRNA ligase n=1 Tax=Pasteuria penetrans TaxID=86005 RepID=UPI0011EED212|nr:valine--tRNA ligase [Pasteuria penetrans]